MIGAIVAQSEDSSEQLEDPFDLDDEVNKVGATVAQSEERNQRIGIHPELRMKMYQAARELRKPGTRTEFLLWQELRAGKLQGRKFRRQQPIGPFVVDFFCPTERLVVEVDGAAHRDQQEHDRARQELIESAGYRFVRVDDPSQVEHLGRGPARQRTLVTVDRAGRTQPGSCFSFDLLRETFAGILQYDRRSSLPSSTR